jgi:hypothetical protein
VQPIEEGHPLGGRLVHCVFGRARAETTATTTFGLAIKRTSAWLVDNEDK